MKHRITVILFLAAVAVSAFLIVNISLLIFVLVALGLVFLILLSVGVTTISANWFMSSISKAGSNQICFTFDDGPNAYTNELLDVLKSHNARGTFFLIGKNCEEDPETVKRIADEGHVIGNHSYSHQNNFAWSSTKKVIAEIEKTNEVIQKITGQKVQAFRPPFGVTNPKIARAVKELKMIPVGWSIRTYDTNGGDTEKITRKVKSGIQRGGNIVLMHDSCESSVTALDKLISFCREKGMEIVSVDQIK